MGGKGGNPSMAELNGPPSQENANGFLWGTLMRGMLKNGGYDAEQYGLYEPGAPRPSAMATTPDGSSAAAAPVQDRPQSAMPVQDDGGASTVTPDKPPNLGGLGDQLISGLGGKTYGNDASGFVSNALRLSKSKKAPLSGAQV